VAAKEHEAFKEGKASALEEGKASALEEGKASASAIGKGRRLLHATIFITGMAPYEFTVHHC
jgi:flagellar biosynthesis/type III secretory pathway protein FliH